MIKYGKTKSGNQRYICRACGKTRVENFAYLAYKRDINQNIIQLAKEGLGIRSTARILKISTTTLLKRIVSIARNIVKPIISKGKIYEVDELCTYIRYKRNFIWLVYALERDSKNVVSFNVGKRNNKSVFGTNHIERKNLTLRTHLKRLNRRTICYSKSLVVLIAILKIYFWF